MHSIRPAVKLFIPSLINKYSVTVTVTVISDQVSVCGVLSDSAPSTYACYGVAMTVLLLLAVCVLDSFMLTGFSREGTLG